MSNKRTTYCWDANVFVGWLGEESTAPLADIQLVLDEIDSGKAVLLVPVTAYSEILEAKNTPEAMELFRKFLERSNVVVADTTKAIAEKAGEIRSRGLQAKVKRNIRTPDATFMATAIIYRADAFHTLEKTQLPQLSGTDIVDKLKICAPGPLSGHRSLLPPASSG
jgi:predicted nucleic acid-binding protein